MQLYFFSIYVIILSTAVFDFYNHLYPEFHIMIITSRFSLQQPIFDNVFQIGAVIRVSRVSVIHLTESSEYIWFIKAWFCTIEATVAILLISWCYWTVQTLTRRKYLHVLEDPVTPIHNPLMLSDSEFQSFFFAAQCAYCSKYFESLYYRIWPKHYLNFYYQKGASVHPHSMHKGNERRTKHRLPIKA